MEEVKMQNLKAYQAPMPGNQAPGAIVVSNEIDITHETRANENSDQPVKDAPGVW